MEIKNFRINIVGDLDYEDLVADIKYKGKVVAMLTQEKGYDNLEIEIYPPEDPNEKYWVFNFDEFNDAIQTAKRGLWDFRKLPEDENSSEVND